MIERELKLGLLNPPDLPRLLAALPKPLEVVVQENHYLVDPEGKASQAGIMVRLRVEDRGGKRRARLTLKRRLEAKRGVVVSWEKEEDFPLTQALEVAAGSLNPMQVEHEGVHWLRDELGIETLTPQGMLKNHRCVIQCEGFLLEVDESHFPDGSVDAEVEVETDDPEGARAMVTRLAKSVQVKLFEQARGKYSRYLKRRAGP